MEMWLLSGEPVIVFLRLWTLGFVVAGAVAVAAVFAFA